MSGEFRQIGHTADIGVELMGDTLEELFEAASRAAARLLSDEDSEPREKIELSFTAEEPESLLIDFLNELIYIASVRGWVPCAAAVTIEGMRLVARLNGSSLREGVKNELKAATYHNLEIKKQGGRWHAEVFFDV